MVVRSLMGEFVCGAENPVYLCSSSLGRHLLPLKVTRKVTNSPDYLRALPNLRLQPT